MNAFAKALLIAILMVTHAAAQLPEYPRMRNGGLSETFPRQESPIFNSTCSLIPTDPASVSHLCFIASSETIFDLLPVTWASVGTTTDLTFTPATVYGRPTTLVQGFLSGRHWQLSGTDVFDFPGSFTITLVILYTHASGPTALSNGLTGPSSGYWFQGNAAAPAGLCTTASDSSITTNYPAGFGGADAGVIRLWSIGYDADADVLYQKVDLNAVSTNAGLQLTLAPTTATRVGSFGITAPWTSPRGIYEIRATSIKPTVAYLDSLHDAIIP